MVFRLFSLIMLLSVFACSDDSSNSVATLPVFTDPQVFDLGSVSADNNFRGARLNDFTKVDDNTYRALILPENTPVNSSPWYAFRIKADAPKRINLEITYGDGFEHRFVPKLSSDGISWKPCDPSQYTIDKRKGTITVELDLTRRNLWVSAQENLNSLYIKKWLDSLAVRPDIMLEGVGASVRGRPITLLRIGAISPEHSIILVGRQHPPEVPGGTIAMRAFIETLIADNALANQFRQTFEILAYPLLNPDGVDNGHWRHNANGVDLNRDWIDFEQPETQAVRRWLVNTKTMGWVGEYRFGIDFHTSHSGPYLLTLENETQSVRSDITNQWIELIETDRNEDLDIRPREQSLPYCYNWMINELGIEAVTYEEGDEVDRDIVKQRAADYATALMRVLIDKYQ